jgi:hypothetical protein
MGIVTLLARKPILALAVAGAVTGLTAASSAAAVPTRITATRITRPPRTLAPGTRVRASSLGQRVFPNASHGFALADVGGAQYPAASVDGGRTWKTNGPALHLNAAQAPLSVVDPGASNAHTFFAFGAGQVADVTADGGRTWWRAFLGGVVLAVVPRVSGGLTAISQDSTSSGNAVTLVYVSTDGGRHWRLTRRFGQA